MATAVKIRHPHSGMVGKGYVGFSWTYLFFGFLVPIIRGEYGIAILHVVATMLTFGLWQLVLPFIYNKQYMRRKMENGWVLDQSDPNFTYAAAKIGIALDTDRKALAAA